MAVGIGITAAPTAMAGHHWYDPWPGTTHLSCTEPNRLVQNETDVNGSNGTFAAENRVSSTRVFGPDGQTVMVQPYDMRVERYWHKWLSNGTGQYHAAATTSGYNRVGTYRYHVQWRAVNGGSYTVYDEFSGSVYYDGDVLRFANGSGPWPNGKLRALPEWRQPYVVVSLVDPRGESYTIQTPVWGWAGSHFQEYSGQGC